MRFFPLMTGIMMMLSIMPMASACLPWSGHAHGALHDLELCGEPPIERQLGNVCVRHEWLCGKQAFNEWFAQWMAEIDSLIFMEKRMGQFIFSGQHQETSWAVFWAPVDQQPKGFAILVSRLRVAPQKEN